jgi:threonine/homoserine/homoserine lactone efflux protein
MTQFVLLGLSLGFTAGVSPGPMLVLVIRETIERGWRAGRLVALAPLLTDLPMIGLGLLVVGALPALLVAGLGAAGGLFVIWLGIESLRPPAVQVAQRQRGSLLRALITNWLNPHPWVFWLVVGAPLLLDGWRSGGPGWVGGFLAAFYALLVGSKLVLAALVARSRQFLQGAAYRRVLQLSSLLLIGLGMSLIVEAVRGLGG